MKDVYQCKDVVMVVVIIEVILRIALELDCKKSFLYLILNLFLDCLVYKKSFF